MSTESANNNFNEEIDIDNTDGRKKDHVTSRYEERIRKEIWFEAIFLLFLVFLSLLLLFLTWKGSIYSYLDIPNNLQTSAKKHIYYMASGMLGGLTFGMKYFYRVVARGWWNQDRRIWRLMSPMISGIVALMIGALIDASLIINANKILNGASIISIGFLAGYFADEAVGKMYEIANVIFGTNNTKKS